MVFKGKKHVPEEPGSAQGEIMRRFRAHPGVFIGTVVILVIVIVTFVLVPALVPEAGGAMDDLVFGTYNKIPIRYVANGYFANIQYGLEQNSGIAVNESNYQAVQREIWQRAYAETVLHTAILDEMKRSGYSAPLKIRDRDAALLPVFQENGRFSPVKYRALDNATRLAILQQVSDRIVQDRYETDLSRLGVGESEAAFIASMASFQRRFDMAVFPVDDYPDSEKAAFAGANPGLFIITRLSKVTVNASEREARRVLALVTEGTISLEEAARTHSQDTYAERGGDMGIKMAWELSEEVSDAAERDSLAALRSGEYSGVVRVPSGWAFFRAEEDPRVADLSDELNMQKVSSYISEYELGAMEDWALGRANECIDLINEVGFDMAASQMGIEKHSFGPLPVNYGSVELFPSLDSFPAADVLDGSLAQLFPQLRDQFRTSLNETFWINAFSAPVGVPSRPFVEKRNVVVLLPREEIEPDADAVRDIKSYAETYWLNAVAEQSKYAFFFTSDKFQDGFDAAFRRYIMPQ